jgi:hypothetical protein
MRPGTAFTVLIFSLLTVIFDDASAQLKLSLKLNWGDRPLITEQILTDTAGNQYVFEQCRFYISGLQASSKSHSRILQPDVLIMGTEDLSDHSWTLPIQNIYKVSGIIGIDSSRQVSGVFEGELDPTKGMYWTWQAGYIHIKIEGKRKSASGSWIPFRYHLGGYRSPHSTIREWSADVLNGEAILRIDLMRFLSSIPEDIPTEVMSPGPQAVLLSDLFLESILLP